MQLDSPSPTSDRAATADSLFPPRNRPNPTTCGLTSPPRDQRKCPRGFPPEQPRAATDRRGFPFLEKHVVHDERINPELLSSKLTTPSSNSHRSPGGNGNSISGGGNFGSASGSGAAAAAAADLGRIHYQSQHHLIPSSSSLPSPASPSPGPLPRKTRNLFPSPFSSTLPPETTTLADTITTFDGNRSSWVGRVAPGGEGGGSRGRQGQQPERLGGAGRGGGGGGRELVEQVLPPPLSPTRHTKGSHAKLDLLLHEMQRLNGRLDTIVGRLGVLEEERAEMGASRAANDS